MIPPNYPTLDRIKDQMRVTRNMLVLIEQLSCHPNTCDHKLVHSYVLQAMGHLDAAKSGLTDLTKSGK